MLAPHGGLAADRIVFKSGETRIVESWWYDGDTLHFATDAGTIAVARADVLRIEPSSDEPSSLRSDRAPAPPAETAAAPPSAAGATPRPLPAAAELDAAIAAAEPALRREADPAARGRRAWALADLHTLRARVARQAGATDVALDHLEAALELASDHPAARPELGWLRLELGQLDRARALVRDGLARTPDDPALRALQGELLYRDQQLPEALVEFEAALAARPTETALVQRVEKLRRELAAYGAHARRESQHFVLSFDGERDEALGLALTDQLEQALGELAREVDRWPAGSIPVVLSTREQFATVNRSGPEVLGLFDGKIRLPVGGVRRVTPELVRVARHELVHALVHDKGRGHAPRWLHEGLAQRLEPRPAEPVDAVLAQAAETQVLSIEPFSYPTALSFVSFLDRQYSRARVLWFIDALAEGQSEDEALLRAFGASSEDLQRAWLESIRSPRRN